jgi:hypothetical protein
MRLITTLLLAALLLMATGCGDDDDPITTIEAAQDASGPASLSGFIVVTDGNARLCEVLAESFPPQCGGAFVTITNIDDVDVEFTTEQSVRWTDGFVELTGTLDDGDLTVE